MSPPRARLSSEWEPCRGLVHDFSEEATLGRRAGNDLVLDSPAVSGSHARIRWEPTRGVWLLEDLESLNGTRVDGVRVVRPEPLDGLSLIELGGVCRLLFRPLSAAASAGEPSEVERTRVGEEVAALPRALADGEAAEGGRATTRVEALELELPEGLAEGAGVGSAGGAETPTPRYALAFAPGEGVPAYAPLGPGENVVGRAEGCQVEVDTQEMSRRHALLVVTAEGLRVSDLGSSNGTWIGERRVEGAVEVQPGDRLRFGRVEAEVVRDDG